MFPADEQSTELRDNDNQQRSRHDNVRLQHDHDGRPWLQSARVRLDRLAELQRMALVQDP